MLNNCSAVIHSTIKRKTITWQATLFTSQTENHVLLVDLLSCLALKGVTKVELLAAVKILAEEVAEVTVEPSKEIDLSLLEELLITTLKNT